MNFNSLIDRDDLFYTVFPDGRTFLWRLLSIKEYRKFCVLRSTGQWHPYYLYSKVFERCYEDKLDLLPDDMPMFVPTSIGALCMYLSGDCESESAKEDITVARGMYVTGDLTETLKRTILLAYSRYTPTELDLLTRPELIRLFVQAEAFLQYQVGDKFKPLDISKITSGSEMAKTPKARFEAVNFELENEGIKKQTHPWDEVDRMEAEYQASKQPPPKLTAKQLAELDRLQKR